MTPCKPGEFYNHLGNQIRLGEAVPPERTRSLFRRPRQAIWVGDLGG